MCELGCFGDFGFGFGFAEEVRGAADAQCCVGCEGNLLLDLDRHGLESNTASFTTR